MAPKPNFILIIIDHAKRPVGPAQRIEPAIEIAEC